MNPDNTSNTNQSPTPRKRAVALQYGPDDIAPKLLAKGAGVIADKILENATNSDIPVYQDKALVEELTRLDLGENIPPELYEVVAQILIFISDLDKIESMKTQMAQEKTLAKKEFSH